MYKIIKYWLRILEMKQNKYVYIVYNLLKRDLELRPHKVNWCSNLKALLCSLGFYDAWLYQGVGDVEGFLKVVKQRLNDQFVQNWNSRLQQSSRARFYNTISIFRLQPYLDNVNIQKFSNALSRLRLSSHRLQIEAGRWTGTPLNERKCFYCNNIEDEYHFIIECDFYRDLRKNLIDRKYWIRPSMFKFVELIQSENENTLRNLGTYIYKAFSFRNDIAYEHQQ